MAPAGTPQAIIERLAAAGAKAARAPDIIEKLQREGVDPPGCVRSQPHPDHPAQ